MTAIRMLRFAVGVAKLVRVHNVGASVGVVDIAHKLGKMKLWCLGHVLRIEKTHTTRVNWALNSDDNTGALGGLREEGLLEHLRCSKRYKA